MKIRSAAVALTIAASVIGNTCILPSMALAAEVPMGTTPVVIQEIMSPMIPMSYADARYLVRIEQSSSSASCNGHCYVPVHHTQAVNVNSGVYEINGALPPETKSRWGTVLQEQNYDPSYKSRQITASHSIVLRL